MDVSDNAWYASAVNYVVDKGLMMGFLGMGNNPMVGATVAVAVAVEEAMK